MKDALCQGIWVTEQEDTQQMPACPGNTREIPAVEELKTIAAKIPQLILSGLLGAICLGSYF